MEATAPLLAPAVDSPRRIRPAALVVVVAVLALGALTTNPVLTPFAILSLLAIAFLVWRKGEPPALLFACGMQWLQAAAAIFYTDIFRSTLTEAFGGVQLAIATWLSLCGVLTLALGARLGLVRAGALRANEISREAHGIDTGRAFAAYFVAFLVSLGCAVAAIQLPSLSQPLLFVGTLKWLFVFMLAYCVLEQRKGYALLAVVCGLEFSIGILGFFAGFKNVFFVLAVAVVTSRLALRGRRLVLISGLAALLLLLGSVWTAVKSDYREFLNQGFRSQEVLVPVQERVGKLSEVVSGFDLQQLAEGFETLILRLSYVQFFALTMNNVPDNVPYENGALWFSAIKHVLTPRVLFPNKPAIDDSARTSYYTGLDVAGAEQGTSIGIGYFAESYVDFGPVLMFGPILLLGIAYGLIYRAFVIKARYKLLGGAIVTSIMVFGGSAIETSNMKILGGNITMLIILGTSYAFFGGALMRWLAAKRNG